VAWPDIERAQRELERGAAGADRGRGGDAQELGELLLESGNLRTLRHLPAADDPRDALGVVVAESRPGVRNEEGRRAPQRFSRSRIDWKASAYLTRA
jgi:hypothetical protein